MYNVYIRTGNKPTIYGNQDRPLVKFLTFEIRQPQSQFEKKCEIGNQSALGSENFIKNSQARVTAYLPNRVPTIEDPGIHSYKM